MFGLEPPCELTRPFFFFFFSFFSSYQLAATGWNYVLGQFASRSVPLVDSVKLTVLREGKIIPETFTVRSLVSYDDFLDVDYASHP